MVVGQMQLTEGSERQAFAVVRSETVVACNIIIDLVIVIILDIFVLVIVTTIILVISITMDLPADREECQWRQSRSMCRRCLLASSCKRL